MLVYTTAEEVLALPRAELDVVAATKSLSPLQLQSFLAAYHAGEKRIVV
jgi:hypothetical protein